MAVTALDEAKQYLRVDSSVMKMSCLSLDLCVLVSRSGCRYGTAAYGGTGGGV